MNSIVKRLGIIGSSGGSAIVAASRCIKAAGKKIDWVIVTDRKCRLEDWAKENGFEAHRVPYLDTTTFSSNACTVFQASSCSDVILFYTRRIASPLIDELRVVNIHPGLLPSFVGLRAVEQALKTRVRLLGATLHHVDAGIDTGPIIAQVATALPAGLTIKHAQHLSYLQKVWLTLVWFEQISTISTAEPMTQGYGPGVALACPGLADESLRTSYLEWLIREEGLESAGICV